MQNNEHKKTNVPSTLLSKIVYNINYYAKEIAFMGTQDKNDSEGYLERPDMTENNRPVGSTPSWVKTNFSIESTGSKPYDIKQMTGQPTNVTGNTTEEE